jgi:hypothetical protein
MKNEIKWRTNLIEELSIMNHEIKTEGTVISLGQNQKLELILAAETIKKFIQSEIDQIEAMSDDAPTVKRTKK